MRKEGKDIRPQVGAQAAHYFVPCRSWASRAGVPKSPEPHLVSKDHEPIVCLAPDGAAHTLGCMAHGIEGEEVILPDLELVPQILQPGLGDEEAEVESLPPPPPPPPTHTHTEQCFPLTLRIRLWV